MFCGDNKRSTIPPPTSFMLCIEETTLLWGQLIWLSFTSSSRSTVPGVLFFKMYFWVGVNSKNSKNRTFHITWGNSRVGLQSSGYSNGFLGTWGKSMENPTSFLIPDANPTFELDVEELLMSWLSLPPCYVGLSFQLDKRPHDLLEAIKCTMC